MVKLPKHITRLIVIATVVLLIVVVLGWFVFRRLGSSTHKPRPQAADASTAHSANSTGSLTAGGVAVPEAWQKRAKSVGYYCPSWAAKPGQVVSDICLSLDK